MSDLLFISDCHFGHRNINKYRPQFSSAEEHDEVLFDNIMSNIGKRTTLWMLGDTCFNAESFPKIADIADKVLNLNYIPGNHDTDKPERQSLYQTMVKAGFFNKTGSLFKEKGFWICHAPIHPVELRGKGNIHGHTHGEIMPEPDYINICVEHTDFKPISIEEIKERHQARKR